MGFKHMVGFTRTRFRKIYSYELMKKKEEESRAAKPRSFRRMSRSSF